MSHLPCEILDHIVDLLHDRQTPLRSCCLVSKSWVPRARTHLFAEVEFDTAKSLQSWKGTFPDPSTSPARYTKALTIRGSQVVTAADVETGSWIRGFSRVARLAMVGQDPFVPGWADALVLLHGFSPAVKSLHMDSASFPFRHFFNLVLSFPFLEDLAMLGCHDAPIDNGSDSDVLPMSTAVQSPSLPAFTGTLELYRGEGLGLVGHWLLSTPGGIHFRRLSFTWAYERDASLTMGLVENCSHTLESLYVCNSLYGTFIGDLHPHG